MKRLLILIWLIPSVLWAAPSVSTISGTISNGQTITVSGSGFGGTGPTIIIFDDFENKQSGGTHTNGNLLETTSGSATIGNWTNLEGYNATTYSNTYVHSGTLAEKANYSTASGSPGSEVHYLANASKYAYMTYWVYYANNIPSNWKTPWLLGPGPFENDFTNNANGSWWHLFSNSVPNLSSYGVDELDSKLAQGVWTRYDIYIYGSTSANGIVEMHTRNSNGTATNYNHHSIRTLNTDGEWSGVTFPGFSANSPEAGTDVYADDFYLAVGSGARARVEIGNNSSYSSCTNLTICTPTSWADTSIEATVRAGSFTEGTAYLFVTDSSGVTSAGKEITFGGESSTPAPPTISNGTISNGSFR